MVVGVLESPFRKAQTYENHTPTDQNTSRLVSNTFRQIASLVVFIVTALLTAKPVHCATPAGDWFLQAGATGDGKSAASPTGSAVKIEHQSVEGDNIILLPGEAAIEGGLALKAGQHLIGVSHSGHKPVITNSDATRNDGCGIVIADDNRVWNLRIENTHASGIYGLNTSGSRIDNVDVHGANRSESFVEASYSTLPGSLPHGGMVFVHSSLSDGTPAGVSVTSSRVTQSAGFGIVSITSDSARSSLSVSHTKVEGGSRIGFYDAGISTLVQGSAARVQLLISDSEVQGRLSRSGRNVMVVASGGAHANTRIERFVSGPTGQDGIVGAVMQSPSEISITISDSLIEGAGQMNVEGSLINLPPVNPLHADQARVSIEIEGSTIRNAGAVGGFEYVAANVWLGASQFVEDSPPAKGQYQLRISNSRIEGAGRVGLEFGDLEFLSKGLVDKSNYDVVLRGNTIVNNGDAEIMIYAPHAHIDARRNCWGQAEGLPAHRVTTLPPARLTQLDVSEPSSCEGPK